MELSDAAGDGSFELLGPAANDGDVSECCCGVTGRHRVDLDLFQSSKTFRCRHRVRVVIWRRK